MNLNNYTLRKLCYKKPELVKIDMKVGETVLGDACKFADVSGPLGLEGSCYIDIHQNTCDTISGS